MADVNPALRTYEDYPPTPGGEAIAVMILGAITAAVSLHDVIWLKRNLRFAFATRDLYVGLNAAFGISAGASALRVALPYSNIFLQDIMQIARCVWLYYFARLAITLFVGINTYGGRAEGLEMAGNLLDEADIPPLVAKGPPPMWLCSGRKFKPSKAFIAGCIFRVELYIGGFVALLVARQLAFDGGVLAAADIYLRVVTAALTFLGLSGVLPIVQIAQPLLLPAHRGVWVARVQLLYFIVLWMGVVQEVLIALIAGAAQWPWWAEHYATILAVELLAVQAVCHKLFLPPRFTWRFPAPEVPDEMKASRESVLRAVATLRTSLPPEEWRAAFDKDHSKHKATEHAAVALDGGAQPAQGA